MAGNIIDATLRFVDKFTAPMSAAVATMQKSAKQYQRMGKEIQKTGDSISAVGSKMTTGVTIPIAVAGAASFKLASDMAESMNKVEVAFGNSANNIKDWSKTTLKSYGIAQGTALDMAATYGDMATGMGLSQSSSADLAKSMVGLAGDLSSFKNISVDIANTALNGIFTGETESLKQLGIVMTETNLNQFAMQEGYGKTVKEMSQQEKVMLRYNYVMTMTKNSQGDFARTQGGSANQMRIFTEGMKQLGASFGTILLPYGTKAITMLNGLVSKFSNLDDKQKTMIVKFLAIAAAVGPALLIFGKMTSTVGKTVSAIGKIGSAITKAGGVIGLLTGPGAIVIAVLAAIVVAGVLIYKNWDKLKALAIKVGTAIKTAFLNSGLQVGRFSETFSQMKEQAGVIVGNLGVIFGKIIEFMRPIVTFMANNFIMQFKLAFNMIIGIATGLGTSIMGAINGIMTVFTGLTDFIAGVFTGNWGQAWSGVVQMFSGTWQTLTEIAKAPLNAVIGLINGAIAGINSIGLSIPDWVPGVGGKSFSVNMAPLAYLYRGTNNWGGGPAMIHDRGAEIVDLPSGTRVYPHDKSLEMARAEGSGKNIQITVAKLAEQIIVKSQEDIEAIADALAKKLEDTALNMA